MKHEKKQTVCEMQMTTKWEMENQLVRSVVMFANSLEI